MKKQQFLQISSNNKWKIFKTRSGSGLEKKNMDNDVLDPDPETL